MFNEKVHVLDHPLLQHKLTILRDERTGVKEFREIVSEIAALECYEATRDLPLEDIEVKTPVAEKGVHPGPAGYGALYGHQGLSPDLGEGEGELAGQSGGHPELRL